MRRELGHDRSLLVLNLIATYAVLFNKQLPSVSRLKKLASSVALLTVHCSSLIDLPIAGAVEYQANTCSITNYFFNHLLIAIFSA